MRSSCFGAGKFVAVGDAGIIHTSPDGLTWDDGRRPVTSTLRKVIFANGQFIAVGENGAIATSPDGFSWILRNSGTTDTFHSVAYGNGQYVACGQGGRLASSSNGTTWSIASVGTDDLNWIAFGNGVFVVAAPNISGGQMAVRVSSDGQTWSTQAFPSGYGTWYPSILYEGVFGNGRFVASANVEYRPYTGIYQPTVRLFTSTDATNWIAGPFTSGTYHRDYYAHRFLAFGNGLFYEFTIQLVTPYSENRVLYTADGTAVSLTFAPMGTTEFTSMTYANGLYVLAGQNGKVWTSTTGTNWSQAYGGIRNNISQIIRGADSYFAAAKGAPILTSRDGLNFSPVQGSPALAYGDIAFDGTNYVAVAAAGALYTSSDGRNWVARTSNTGNDLLAACKGAARWAAVGRNGAVITSPNALAWTLRTSGTANTLNGVAYGNGTFVSVGNVGTIITSPDGTIWDAQFSGTTNNLNSVRYLNGQFFAVGANGTILNSADAVIWQGRNSPVSATFKTVTFGNGRFLAAGYAAFSVVIQSTNGVDWEDITTKVPDYPGVSSLGFFNGSFFVGGDNGSILQSDSIDGIPRLTGTRLPSGAGFQVRLALNVPSSYRIQASTNLAQNSWEDAVTISNPVPPFTWTDSSTPGFPTRCYRVVSP